MFHRMSLSGGIVRLVGATSLVLATLLAGAPASAQQFGLPIEVLQGAAFDAGPVTPYQVDFAVIPSLDWDKFRLGAKLGRSYDNPGWNWRGGVRAGAKVVAIEPMGIGGVGLWLEGEATSTSDGDWRYGAGLTFDLDGLLAVGAWGGYDQMHDGGWFGITVGFDPTSFRGCIKDEFDETKCREVGGTP